jgi:hypothetical protein
VTIGATLSSKAAGATALLRRNSRLVVAVVLAGGGLLLGVAIGYSAGQRGPDQQQAAAAPALEKVDSGPSSVRESVSSGGIAPLPAPARRSTARTSSRGQASVAGRSGTRLAQPPVVRRDAASVPVPANTATGPAPGAATPPVVASAPDSSAVRAQRDSVTRVNALTAERESIRREIEMRRARVDSIERARLRLDSLRRAGQPAAPPAGR